MKRNEFFKTCGAGICGCGVLGLLAPLAARAADTDRGRRRLFRQIVSC